MQYNQSECSDKEIEMAQERFIQLSLQRKLKNGSFKVITTRSYLHAQNATVKAVELLMFAGQPLDVVEVAHTETGNQFGTVKMSATGRVMIDIDQHHPMLIAHTKALRACLKGHEDRVRQE